MVESQIFRVTDVMSIKQTRMQNSLNFVKDVLLFVLLYVACNRVMVITLT